MINKILELVKEYNPKADLELIKRAYHFADNAHKNQKRLSGEQYIIHPLKVTLTVANLKGDTASICASLLHDTLEDCNIKPKELEKEFNKEILLLVEGLTKIRNIPIEIKTASYIRKVLLATTKDIRIIIIKLADKLDNMRTLKYHKPEKRKKIAEETLNIYAPVAQKLGMYELKGELEDLSLKHLKPEIYQHLKQKVNQTREEREERIKTTIKEIKELLKEINVNIKGRAKYFYSIYKSMKKKHKEFSEIYDLTALRIITNTTPDCYLVLGKLHEKYKPLSNKFKDYIAVPKKNGYQSLHTTVITKKGSILEIQIRTKQMHTQAEEGVASHWIYKGTERDKQFDQRIAWLKELLEWKTSEKAFVENLKFDLFEKEIIVFTPKGDPIILPENSTPIDFAYEVHSNIGNNCSKAEVNSKIVPLDYILKSGEVVNIMTKKDARPSRQWLKFVKTSKARTKISQALNIKSIDFTKQESKKENIIKEIICDSKKQLKLSKCCSPKSNDLIKGFLTKDGKITIHKADCINCKTLKKEIKVSWEEKKEPIKIRILVENRTGMLADLLSIITSKEINIQAINSRNRKDKVIITMSFEKKDENIVDQLINNFKLIQGVLEIEKVKE